MTKTTHVTTSALPPAAGRAGTGSYRVTTQPVRLSRTAGPRLHSNGPPPKQTQLRKR